jgi:hypothetical protein
MPYHTTYGSFDIHERNDGKIDVILMPKLPPGATHGVGNGKYLATFETRKEAEDYCDNWRPENL